MTRRTRSYYHLSAALAVLAGFMGVSVGDGRAGQVTAPSAQSAPDAPVMAAIEHPDIPPMAIGQKLYNPKVLRTFYNKLDERPVLAKTYSAALRADMATVLAESWQQGMNPETYRAALIADELKKPGADKNLDLDRLMLDALARYIGDMTGMRLKAANIDLRARDWRKSLPPEDAIKALLAAPDPVVYLKSLAPQSRLYAKLQDELVILKPLLEAGKGTDAIYPFKPIKKSIRPGDINAAIVDLRDRLGVKTPVGGDANEYDDALAQVVMQFQRNHGLKDDGIIGRDTVRFFNQTYFERYRQVIANLERMRWLEPVKPAKYIVVNIPAATLWAVENDAVVAEMPVIVGRKKRATNQFKTDIIGVRFNPTWTVPETIKKEDFLPELLKNPDFLAHKGVEVFRKDGDDMVRLDPTYVDWEDVTEADLADMRMVQPSGRSNSLGQIRVLMPNQYDIYLHDTNTPEYFRDDDRTISSGCVRLSRPKEIAKFVLQGAEGWSDDKLDAILATDKTREFRANHPFPAILLYQSAWLKKDGSLVMAYDIYEEDIKLYNALKSQDLIPEFIK